MNATRPDFLHLAESVFEDLAGNFSGLRPINQTSARGNAWWWNHDRRIDQCRHVRGAGVVHHRVALGLATRKAISAAEDALGRFHLELLGWRRKRKAQAGA